MHFAVDAHAIGRRLTGNEVYVRNLLEEFSSIDSEARFTAYYSVPEATERIPRRFTRRQVAANPFLRLGWDLRGKLKEDRPDVVHVQYTAPVACPAPVVVSVHDVSYLEHPEYFPAARATQLRLTVARTVRRAARVLSPSEYSRQRILHHYRLPEERVVTIPNGVSHAFRPVHRGQAIERTRQRFHLQGPFLLSVGDIQPRKNHIGLLGAYRELLRSMPGLRHELVLAGKETWFGEDVRRAVRERGLDGRVRFLGFVSDDELIDLYNAADLFVFPSLYEGFGLPILEAMACGRAVACSNTTAMPEVANATALLFDPHSVDEMTRAIRDLLVDPELRARMERLSLQRAAQFSWAKAAERTLDLYYEVAEERMRRRMPRTAAAGRR
jgi:glycosyltransferase involved in cell wall biosynthesis